MNKIVGLYVHIPFCEKKCHYCDFLTFTDQNDEILDYVNYLIKEIQMYEGKGYILDTIYIGGGTPSYLDANLMSKIISTIKEVFILEEDCEITIELNPESVNKKKIITYLKSGINRFSMGVQSFDNQVLRIMGRIHRKETVFEKLQIMKELGCKNISIDLMMANPKQDINVLKNDLSIAVNLDVNHISYYSLILKEKTHFEWWVNEGKFELFDPIEERKMYHLVTKTLKSHGFNQYEISSFSKEGYESIHNQKYWNLKNYLGVGMGASANIDLIRTTNTRRFKTYYKMIDSGRFPIEEKEVLSLDAREKEYLMLNLRMLKGFNILNINKKFNINFENKYKKILDKYLDLGVIERVGDSIRFTETGVDSGNLMFRDLYDLD